MNNIYFQLFFCLLNEFLFARGLNFCDKNLEIITDFTPKICDVSKKEYYELDKDCFPSCVMKSGPNERCSFVQACAPGLKCNVNTFECEIDEKSCGKYNFQPSNLWKPQCLLDGSYAPKQCKGEQQNGRCYCFDASGNRIFGEEWSYNAENMTCACSRRRADLEQQGREDVTLHCDSRGSYEPLQCDSGLCWCVEQLTGKVLDAVVPETMMTLLPCYDSTKVGSQYLRKCESQLIGRARIRQEFETHGTMHISYPVTKCDWDGSFGRYKIMQGAAYCTWRDDSLIGSYQSPVGPTTKDVTCNCARDKKIYALEGIDHLKECEFSGNYKEKQQIGDLYYCVDADGFATTKLSEQPITDCPSY